MSVALCSTGVKFDIFDNHIKGPWKTPSWKLTGGEPWTILKEYGNLPYPPIVRNHDVSHPVNCFAYAMSHELLVYSHDIWDKTNGHWYGTEGFLGHQWVPGAKREVSFLCLDPDGCMVRSSTDHYCFVTILYNETTGADEKPGGDIMVLRCKKGELFITGEVFPLDISLLMGAGCYNLSSN